MKESLQKRIEKARTLLAASDCILIGGGSGLSSAAGLTYSGERFAQNFAEFIERYCMTDMYTAGFYPFKTQEEKWAYWSRHILLNRWQSQALALYRNLLALVKEKDYFVITTNVDAQFYKAGFAPERIFAVQGDYGKLQCAKGCHDTLYDNEALIRQMTAKQKNCRVPSYLIPKCPVCGGEIEVNIRKDMYFVQDDAWYASDTRYSEFCNKSENKNTVLLELGVGFNTPTIIRFPFERMTYRNKNVRLIRLNAEYEDAIPENETKTVSFNENMAEIINALMK